MRRTGLLTSSAVVLVFVATVVGVVLGPSPFAPVSSDTLTPMALLSAIDDSRDRVILLMWILIPIAIVGFVAMPFRGRSTLVQHSRVPTRREVITASGLGVAAIAIVVGSVTWSRDSAGYWHGVAAIDLVAGAAFAVFVLRMWTWPTWVAYSATLIAVGTVAVVALPALLQTPATIRDSPHFAFTSDEIAAVAAGRFPLSDYAPVYSNLLGYPVSALIHLVPSSATLVVVAWLLILQVIALGIAVALPVLVSGWRMIAPAAAVAILPSLAVTVELVSASTYFAVLPLRVVLPAIVILAAFLLLRGRPLLESRSLWRVVLLGFLAGVAALNNTDFGVPVVAILVVVVLFVGHTFGGRIIAASVAAGSALLPFVLYALIGIAFNRPVDWSLWLAYPRIFGLEGYYNVAMEAFGLHIAVVALFVSATAVGVCMLVSGGPRVSTLAYRQGLLLLLTGGWALLTLPYFAGRSLTPTVIGGYAFGVGLVIASFLPLVRASYRALKAGTAQSPTGAAVSVALGAVMLACVGGFFLRVQSPWAYLEPIARNPSGEWPPLASQLSDLDRMLADPANAEVARLNAEGRIDQVLPLANLTGLGSTLPSAMVVSHASYFDLSPEFVRMQCEQQRESGRDFLLLSRASAAAFATVEECREAFDLDAATTISSEGDGLVLLSLRGGTPSRAD